MTAARRVGTVPLLACLLAVAAVPAAAQDPPELQAGTLRLATWRGSFLGRGAEISSRLGLGGGGGGNGDRYTLRGKRGCLGYEQWTRQYLGTLP